MGWEGTDFNNNHLVSSTMMLPHFYQQHGADMYNNQRMFKYDLPSYAKNKIPNPKAQENCTNAK